MTDFRSAREQAAAAVEAAMAQAMGPYDGPVAQAMSYALTGGKALRGFFVLETARLHGVEGAEPAALAIECIHAYSLVHDDLPCMDDDDLRRGNPTVHRKWDEATAVLSGDALQAFAFEQIGRCGLPDAAKLSLMTTLAEAAGIAGMVGGQAQDMAAELAATPLSLDQITTLQAGKTGALITWSCLAGPRMTQSGTGPLQVYGDAIGLAFQIADDILDVESDAATLGKATQKDAHRGKATFVSLLGLDGAKGRAKELVEQACDALSAYKDDADTLREAAQFVIARKH